VKLERGHREKKKYLRVKLIREMTADGTSSTHLISPSESADSLESAADLRFDPLESCAMDSKKQNKERWKNS
jgi:hypothetical protein